MKNSDITCRVLQIVTNMDRAGLETMLMNYYRHIDRSIMQFDFLMHRSDESDYEEEITQLGGRIYRLPAINLKNISGYQKRAVCFFENHHEYKIVHAHMDALSVLPLRAARQSDIPVRIAHSHNNHFDREAKMLIRMLLKKCIPHYATDLFGCSKEAVEFMFGHRQAHVLHNAIDSAEFSYNEKVREQIREDLGLERKFVVGHVGRFGYQKNHRFLLEIFREIHLLFPESVLLLVGDGKDKTSMQQWVIQNGLQDNVKFLGVCENVPQLLQAMDVFVLPSHFEGLGVVLIEAQAAGLPCFASADVVSREAKITDLLKFIPLDNGAAYWARQILDGRNAKRRINCTPLIKEAGYDIVDQAQWLQSYYLKRFNL